MADLPFYSIRVSSDNINLIGAALGKIPYEQVAPLINDLRSQVQAQQAIGTVEGKTDG